MMSDRGIRPTVVHASMGMETLCGVAPFHVAKKYMSDEFYSTLPKCEKCYDILSELREGKKVVVPKPMKIKENITEEGLFLISFKEL